MDMDGITIEIPAHKYFRPTEQTLFESAGVAVYIKMDTSEEDLHPFFNCQYSACGKQLNSTLHHLIHRKIMMSRVKNHKLLTSKLEATTHWKDVLKLGENLPYSVDWEARKVMILAELTVRKGLAHFWFCRRLLSTGNKRIIDFSPSEFWGMGDAKRGENNCGYATMLARQELRRLFPELCYIPKCPMDVDIFSARGQTLACVSPNTKALAMAKHRVEACQVKLEGALTNLRNLTILSERQKTLSQSAALSTSDSLL